MHGVELYDNFDLIFLLVCHRSWISTGCWKGFYGSITDKTKVRS